MGRKKIYDRPGRPTVDRTGQRYGPLTVIRIARKEPNNHCWKWLCRCVCGNTVEVRGAALKKRKSCTCRPRGNIPVPPEFEPKKGTYKHGMGKTPEAKVWREMIRRCTNPKDTAYRNYGGRGIAVCDRWLRSFESFIGDMGKRPSDLHTIERIDNNGPYAPENCCWKTMREQAVNTRRNHLLSCGERTMTVSQWASESGVPIHCIIARLSRGWSERDAVAVPPRKRTIKRKPGEPVTACGEQMSIPQWAERNGIPVKTIYARISSGWLLSDAVTKPLRGSA